MLVHKVITLHALSCASDQGWQNIFLLYWHILHLDTGQVDKHKKYTWLFGPVAVADVQLSLICLP